MTNRFELTLPTPDLVREACKKFDDENGLIEDAVGDTFKLYPTNEIPKEVLVKVVVLNRLYSTQIFAVVDVALNICKRAAEIDSFLRAGSPEAARLIADVEVQGRVRHNYSFASKYCSWHNPCEFPIYDSRVDNYLWNLHKQTPHLAFQHEDLWDYPRFAAIMRRFREHFELHEFSFKEIDKFLWLHGSPPEAASPSADPASPSKFPAAD
jgi:hypothetical protein